MTENGSSRVSARSIVTSNRNHDAHAVHGVDVISSVTVVAVVV
jgi:hypothetical protein